MRSQFAIGGSPDTSNKGVGLDVQVHVERSVTVTYPSQAYEVDSYHRPSHVVWDTRR